MNYLLDTNVVIAVMKGLPASVRDNFRRAVDKRSSIAIPSIVLFELKYGVERSARPRENAERLRVFLSGSVDVLPFGEDDAATAGEIRAALEALGTPIGPYDLLIAAQALRRSVTLVTANVGEFSRVRRLKWLDWSANT